MKSLIKVDKTNNKINKIEIIILIVFFVTSLLWAIFMPENWAPDEQMRYLIPQYIYNHNSLPLPDDSEVVHTFFNASYAYYPLLLGSIISAGFMKIAGFLGVGETGLLIASRLTSVCFGTVFVYFLIKIAKKLFGNNSIIKYFAIILGSFIPQLVFLSSYVDNDIIAVSATAIIVYAWICSISSGWDFKNSLLLAVGIIICALSYYNAYAWILMSVIFFICSFIVKKNRQNAEIDINNKKINEKENKNKKLNTDIDEKELTKNKYILDYKNMFKYGIFIAVIVLVGISYLFIRNYVVTDGDFLGMSSFMEACEEGAIDIWKPSQRDTAKNNGMTYIEMLTSTKWVGTTWADYTIKSFICFLGGMQFQIDNWVYVFYKTLAIIGLIGMIIAFFTKTKNNSKMRLFYFCLLIPSIITLCLSIQYSYATDYQAQGRYLYPMWIALIIFITTGLSTLTELINKLINKFIKNNKTEKVKRILDIIIFGILILLIFYIMFILANKLFISTI